MSAEEIQITRRSGWSLIQIILGLTFISIGLVALTLSLVEGSSMYYVIPGALLCIFFGLQSLFISFLINVFTDIRWYLSKLSENSELTNNYLGHQYRRTQSETL